MDLHDLIDRLDHVGTNRPAALAAAFPPLFPELSELVEADWPLGWTPLVVPTLARIAHVVEASGSDVRIKQVKEKLGALRVYADRSGAPEPTRRTIDAILNQADRISARRCVVCGMQGERRSRGGWIAPACPCHAGRRNGAASMRSVQLSAHERLTLSRVFGSTNWRGPLLDREGRRVFRLWFKTEGRHLRLSVVEEADARRASVVTIVAPDPADAMEQVFLLETELTARAERILGGADA